MGISFSMVPAIIWPATTLIVEPRRLGTALGVITMLQNVALWGSNRTAGWLADRAGAGPAHPAGYDTMLGFFSLVSLAALTSAILLWRRERGPHGHGLENARAAPGAAGGMKIAKLETFTNQFVCFVRLTSDSGAVGWGQTSTYNADITARIFHRQVAPWALGADAFDVDALVERIEEREHKFPGSYRCRALAGLDTALWDLRGKLEGKPVVELLGGTPRRLRAYASSMRRDITPAQEAERLVRLRDEQGLRRLQVARRRRVRSRRGRVAGAHRGHRADRGARARRSAPRSWSMPTAASHRPRAIEVGRLLEAEGISHYEEPCPYWKLDETKQVTDALALDVTGGEQDWDLATWARMIEMRAVDVVQPDVMYMGGIARTLKVARMAAAAALPCTPAQRQSLTGHAVHHAPARRAAECRQIPRALDRGTRTITPGRRGCFCRTRMWSATGT